MVFILQIKIFGGNKKQGALEKEINEWLKNNREAKIVDVKLGYSAEGSVGWYSAMVVFETEDRGFL